MITNAGPFLGLFEHSPWVVERAFAAAPFPDKCALHAAMMRVVEDATAAERLALIRAHPELGARQAPLTEASEAEQQGAGLRALSPEEFARFTALNEAYREKFGFPFIICVRLNRAKPPFWNNSPSGWKTTRISRKPKHCGKSAASPGFVCRT